jgi:NADH:ubiquinone oxidoreductase subunit C
MLQYKALVAITVIDYPTNDKRFKICYFLLSYKLNNRIIITVDVSENESIDSITNIYKGAN